MRVLAVASHVASHTDFGGDGYRSVVQHCARRGHTVCWAVPPERAGALSGPDCRVVALPSTPALRRGSPQADAAMAGLAQVVRSVGPDIVLSDRLLDLVPAVTDRMAVPLVAVGTPGGRWARGTAGGIPTAAPTPQAPASLWIDRAAGFLVFMPRRFYREAAAPSALFVRHAEMTAPFSLRDGASGRISVILGNGDRLQALLEVLDSVPREIAVEVFHRTDREVVESADFRKLSGRSGIVLRGWVDLSKALRPSLYAVTLGGVSSIWRALAADLPVLVCPEGRGDQGYNAICTQRSGLGHAHFPGAPPDPGSTPHEAMARLSATMSPKSLVEDDYTHDLDGAVDALEALTR